jgi:hypothetical protein
MTESDRITAAMPPARILPADSVVAETDDPLSAGLAGQLVSQPLRPVR